MAEIWAIADCFWNVRVLFTRADGSSDGRFGRRPTNRTVRSYQCHIGSSVSALIAALHFRTAAATAWHAPLRPTSARTCAF